MEKLIANRYAIQDLLGRGGMGEVYRALDTQTGELVAVKALNPDVLERDPSLLERFAREGQALRQLNHPNIVRMIAAVEEQGSHYLIMEYVGGGSLEDLLAKQGNVPASDVVRISLEVADALTRAHHLGIIHRDLKPANVILAEDGTPRLADFGIAHIQDGTRLTGSGMLIGTVDYISPEVCQGETPDERSDIWSFGVMAYQMLSGRLPFTGESLTSKIIAILTQPIPDLAGLVPDLPDALADLVYRMLEKDPLQRIPSIRLVGAELEAIAKRRPPVTHSRPVLVEAESLFGTPMPPGSAPGQNLPVQTTAFVGREAELQELSRLLGDSTVRLLTILGVGGMGKTRLAIEAGRAESGHFGNGVYFVPLAPVETAEAILPAIAKSLDFSFSRAGEPRRQLLDYLREKSVLLILDNFEHLLEGAGLLGEIMQTAAHVRLLVTSRIKLNVQGEHLFHLEGMDFPDWETPADAMQYSAVKLFLQSARHARPGFELVAADLKYVARICRLVGGMPLGILLAAAWVAMLNPAEIAAEIGQSTGFLETELGDMPGRQRSLQAVLDYAWRSLTGTEQKAFQGLSVFRGGFTRVAAQAVTGAGLHELIGLVDKSLLRRAPTGRYELHELLRQYAGEKLLEAGDAERLRDQHLRFFLELSETAEPEIRSFDQLTWLNRLDEEIDNLRLALAWAQERDKETFLRLASALWRFWDVRGHVEDYDWLTKALALTARVHTATRARGMARASFIAQNISDYPNAIKWSQEASVFAREVGDKPVLVMALFVQSVVLLDRYDIPFALAFLDQALPIAREIQDHWWMGLLHTHYGYAALSRNDLASARSYMEAGLKEARISGDKRLIIHVLSRFREVALLEKNADLVEKLSQETLTISQEIRDKANIIISYGSFNRVALLRGDYALAEQYALETLKLSQELNVKSLVVSSLLSLGWANWGQGDLTHFNKRMEEAVGIAKQSDNPWLMAEPFYYLGESFRLMGDFAQAKINFEQALVHYREENIESGYCECLEGFGQLAIDQGQAARGVRLLGAKERLKVSFALEDFHHFMVEERQRHVAAARAQLGEEAFQRLWSEGRSMTLEQALALALRDDV